MKQPQFSLSTILLLMVIVGMGVGWWQTHRKAQRAMSRADLAESQLSVLMDLWIGVDDWAPTDWEPDASEMPPVESN